MHPGATQRSSTCGHLSSQHWPGAPGCSQVAILPALAKAGASPQDPELQQALWLCVVGGFNMPPGRVDREGRPADEEAAAWERMGRAVGGGSRRLQ